jgi:murein tripeptide amidase MpaA
VAPVLLHGRSGPPLKLRLPSGEFKLSDCLHSKHPTTMRASSLLLVAVSTLLAPTATAVPSHPQPPPPSQHPSHRPAWRSVTDAIVRNIWSPPVHSRPEPAAVNSLKHHKHSDDVVVRFNISNAQDATSLADAADTLFLDLWEFTDDWVDIRLQKDLIPSLLGLLPSSLHQAHSLLMDEFTLQNAISDTYPSSRSTRMLHQSNGPTHHNAVAPKLGVSSSDNIFFNDYQPLSVILPWMRLMASLFTTHVRVVNVGTSFQDRQIPALRIGVHPTNNDSPTRRKTILITAGLHAREWISTSTVNYIAYSLITGYGKNHVITSLLEEFDWVLVPTVNPDGYAYTWEADRLWRKNRQQTSLRFCRGLDLDRSFDYSGMVRPQDRTPVASLSQALHPSKPSRQRHSLAGSATRLSTTTSISWACSICTHTRSKFCTLTHTPATTALQILRTCKKSPPVYRKSCVNQADATTNLLRRARATSVSVLPATTKYSLALRPVAAASSIGFTTR